MVCIVNGKEQKHFEISLTPIFSPDSNRVAYIARDRDKMFAVFDGKEKKRYDSILANTLIFSPDSNKTSYVAKKDGKWFVVVNEEEGKTFDEILKYTPIFSPDSKDCLCCKR